MMKRILFISPTPPNHINRLRTLNLLKAWKGRAEIHFVCLAKERKDYENIEKYKDLFEEVKVFWQPKWLSLLLCLWGVITGKSLQSSYCRNKKLAQYLCDLDLDSFDIIYIKRLRMAQYADCLPVEKVWIDLTDSMQLYYTRLLKIKVSVTDRAIALYERKYLGELERKVIQTYKTIFCSQVDLSYACKNTKEKCRSIIIPNAVDLDNFSYIERDYCQPEYKICYWGNLSVPMNFTAIEILIRDILPKLLEKSPNFQLEIIGPNPPAHLLRMCSGPVKFTGHVERLNTTLSEMDLFVCPLIFGTGVKNKVLQSLALNLPVLTTSIGVEGIDGLEILIEKNMIFIEDNVSDFPDLILSLSKNGASRKKQTRDFVNAKYSIASLRESLANNDLI